MRYMGPRRWRRKRGSRERPADMLLIVTCLMVSMRFVVLPRGRGFSPAAYMTSRPGIGFTARRSERTPVQPAPWDAAEPKFKVPSRPGRSPPGWLWTSKFDSVTPNVAGGTHVRPNPGSVGPMFPTPLLSPNWKSPGVSPPRCAQGFASGQQNTLQQLRAHSRWGLTGTPPVASNAGLSFMATLGGVSDGRTLLTPLSCMMLPGFICACRDQRRTGALGPTTSLDWINVVEAWLVRRTVAPSSRSGHIASVKAVRTQVRSLAKRSRALLAASCLSASQALLAKRLRCRTSGGPTRSW